jgi:hypothetical protein
MKIIVNHKSWNMDEIIDLLVKTGTFTCPTLPHYRYDRVKQNCSKLRKLGFLKKSGKTDVSVNLVVTDLFREWRQEYESKITNQKPIKWKKTKYPSNDSVKEQLRQMMEL